MSRIIFCFALLFLLTITGECARPFYGSFTSYKPTSHQLLRTANEQIIIRTRAPGTGFCNSCPPLTRKVTYGSRAGMREKYAPIHRRPISYRLTREGCSDTICCTPLRQPILMRGLF